MKKLLGILGFCFALSANAQLEIGAVAPEVHVDHVFNKADKVNPTLESLKGKYVVLDFWATWCSPCVASFPKMDKLYTEFKDQNVQFLAISTEKLVKVENFVKHTNYNFWIGVNESREDFKNYKITAIPQVYVINPEGKVVHQTHHLTKEDLVEILAKGKLEQAQKENTSEKEALPYRGYLAGEDPLYRTAYFLAHGDNKDMPTALQQQVLRPSLAPGYYGNKMLFKGDTAKVTFHGATLKTIISEIYNLPSEVYVNDLSGDTTAYDLVFNATSTNQKEATAAIISQLEKNLGVQVKWEKYTAVQNELSIDSLPHTAIHNDSVMEGTYYLYTPFSVFLKHLENKSGEVYTMKDEYLNYTLLNKGIDRGKLYDMTAKEIEDYLIAAGFKVTRGETKIKRVAIQ
ncbi:TlpA family protein disulfide reductase [Lishizhenia tianjinensis]|nr:TlpA disulfide reductase family protein [Lishizhenia tianjinensis]